MSVFLLQLHDRFFQGSQQSGTAKLVGWRINLLSGGLLGTMIVLLSPTLKYLVGTIPHTEIFDGLLCCATNQATREVICMSKRFRNWVSVIRGAILQISQFSQNPLKFLWIFSQISWAFSTNDGSCFLSKSNHHQIMSTIAAWQKKWHWTAFANLAISATKKFIKMPPKVNTLSILFVRISERGVRGKGSCTCWGLWICRYWEIN